MIPIEECQAREVATCRYHKTMLKMDAALLKGDMRAALVYRTQLEEWDKRRYPEEFIALGAEAETLVSMAEIEEVLARTPQYAKKLDQSYKITVDADDKGKRKRLLAAFKRLELPYSQPSENIFDVHIDTHDQLKGGRILVRRLLAVSL